jgi:GNAT superfamily N-acetyltransferase
LTQTAEAVNIDDCFIRRYRLTDIEDIIKLADKYVPQLPTYKHIKVDPTRIRFLLQNNLNSESQFMLKVLCDSQTDKVQGFMVGYCTPAVFSWDLIVSDIFLVLDEAYRTLGNARLLMKVFVKWGLLRNPKIISASHTSGIRPKEMHRFLTDLGFKPIGEIFHYDMSQVTGD